MKRIILQRRRRRECVKYTEKSSYVENVFTLAEEPEIRNER